MIWHDDFVITQDADGSLNRRLVGQLSLAEFKQLSHQRLLRECGEGAEPLDWRCEQEDQHPT